MTDDRSRELAGAVNQTSPMDTHEGPLACPFCGGEAKCNGHPGGTMGQIYCDGEECFGPRTTALTKQDSIVQWNTRAGVAQAAPEVDPNDVWEAWLERRDEEGLGMDAPPQAIIAFIVEYMTASSVPSTHQPMPIEPQAVKETDEVLRLRAAIDYACDLLAERTYGSSARSPGHNARLHLESALAVTRPSTRPSSSLPARGAERSPELPAGGRGERERCIAICENWIGTFQDTEIKYTSAREYAVDAIEDIIDLIRDGHQPTTAQAALPAPAPHAEVREALEKSRNAIRAVYHEIDNPVLPACLAAAWEVADAALAPQSLERGEVG